MLDKFRNKKFNNTICKFIQNVVFTWIYKIILGFSLMVIGAIGSNFSNSEFFYYCTMVGAGILAVIVLVFFVYAWIINPIKGLKK